MLLADDLAAPAGILPAHQKRSAPDEDTRPYIGATEILLVERLGRSMGWGLQPHHAYRVLRFDEEFRLYIQGQDALDVPSDPQALEMLYCILRRAGASRMEEP